jgi:hypothetical protein
LTKPAEDFTNWEATKCPIEWSIVKADGTALDGGLENVLSINSNGKV